MKIKLTQEQADFITQTFSCKSTNYNKDDNSYDNIYFQSLTYTQKEEDKGTCIFEIGHVSELNKKDLISVLDHVISNKFEDIPLVGYNKILNK